MNKRRTAYRKWLIIGSSILVLLLLFFLFFINSFLEPILKKKIHTLIIQGSDSLYTYKLDKLSTDFFGGDVEVEGFEISIDSNRYFQLRQQNALPALTMQLTLDRGHMKSVGILPLLLGKKISIGEIMSKDADIKLTRHVRPEDHTKVTPPLWKAIQPDIRSIVIKKIRLNGVKLKYRDADTATAVNLQFDRFDAELDDLKVDSTAYYDTTRLAFTKHIFMRFHDLEFLTFDSSYNMKARSITYSSKNRQLELERFKMEPTLEKEEFYRRTGIQESLYYITLNNVRLDNIRLDRYIHYNQLEADSIVLDQPVFSVYMDGTQEKVPEDKIGGFPHQKLLKAGVTTMIRHAIVRNASIEYKEKNKETGVEGKINFKNIDIQATNLTNSSGWIRRNNICKLSAKGFILEDCPLDVGFDFYMDSANGRFDCRGTIANITAGKLNPLASAFSTAEIRSFQINKLEFDVRGEDFGASSNVRMRYNNLVLVLNKKNEETGITKRNKFFTKLLNRYMIWPDNPGSDGIERRAENIKVTRLTSQSFFGLIWKAIFAGMQDLMMRSGSL